MTNYNRRRVAASSLIKLLCSIEHFASLGGEGVCYALNKTISDHSGLSERIVRDGIAILSIEKHIQVNRGRRANDRRIVLSVERYDAYDAALRHIDQPWRLWEYENSDGCKLLVPARSADEAFEYGRLDADAILFDEEEWFLRYLRPRR